MAELELAKENYLEAKNDYDSAVAVLPSTFPRISEVIEIKEILEELAKNKTIIIEQDSVLRIAKMTKVELENYMAEICLLYTSPSPRDRTRSRMPSSA